MVEIKDNSFNREDLYMELREDVTELIEMEKEKEKNGSEAENNMSSEKPELQNSRYCSFLLLYTIFSSVPMINYGLTCFNPVLPVFFEMYNETYFSRHGEPMPSHKWEILKALTMSVIVAGAFVGCFILKAVMGCLTRKKCMLVMHYINMVGAVIVCSAGGLTKAYEPIILGRFLMGVANGMALGLVPVIIGETCVKHRRSVYNGLIGVSLAVGSFLGVFFGWPKVFGTAQLWPVIALIPAIPSLIYIVLSIPETPYQLMRTGERPKLQHLMRKLRDGSEAAVFAEIRAMIGEEKSPDSLLEIDYDELSERHDVTLRETLGTRQYRRQFFMVILLFANLMLNGLNHILFFSNAIFLQAGIEPDLVSVASVCVFLFQVIATLPGSFLLHRFGSWMLCIIGNLVMIAGHILIVVSLTTAQTSPELSYLAVLGIAIYLLGFAGGENIGLFPLVGELTTERTRPVCLNFGSAILWFTGWLVGFAATYLQKWLGPNSFLVWMAFTAIFTIYIIFAVPNTKKKSSAELQMHFKMN